MSATAATAAEAIKIYAKHKIHLLSVVLSVARAPKATAAEATTQQTITKKKPKTTQTKKEQQRRKQTQGKGER